MSILIKGAPRRREVLRGILGGGAVTVALPFLDCFLNDHGTALASGAPLPVRFGTWFWGSGFSPGYGISETSSDVQVLVEAKALERFTKGMNYFSGFNVPLDGGLNLVHYTGIVTTRTGQTPASMQADTAPTLDILIGDVIGQNTRFRSIDVAACGGPRASLSARSYAVRNSAETSPVALYQRVFGPEFIDPNKADFKPDPEIMLRQSVLSSVRDESKQLVKKLGSDDKARLDQYFTSVRALEQQLELQLKRPPPNEACRVPTPPTAVEGVSDSTELRENQYVVNTEIEPVLANNKLLASILAMAMACNQTKIFTMTFSPGISPLTRPGLGAIHHTLTHEEPVDPKLGYQAMVSTFNQQSMEGCADFVEAFASLREGAGSLLDNMLIMADSDTSDAKVHALDGIPVMTFGTAGGRIKTGKRVVGKGDPISCVGLTLMQVMGVPIDSWGAKSTKTSKTLTEILV
jgi:hypothetical protein